MAWARSPHQVWLGYRDAPSLTVSEPIHAFGLAGVGAHSPKRVLGMKAPMAKGVESTQVEALLRLVAMDPGQPCAHLGPSPEGLNRMRAQPHCFGGTQPNLGRWTNFCTIEPSFFFSMALSGPPLGAWPQFLLREAPHANPHPGAQPETMSRALRGHPPRANPRPGKQPETMSRALCIPPPMPVPTLEHNQRQ